MPRIPIAGPSITQLEIDYVTDAARNGWYEHANDYPSRFERAFADHTGRRFAAALPSCTAGLHLALAALDIGPGDEVIVPDCTWIATAAPISYVGAQPVFVDIDPITWCLCPRAFEAAITPRTRAAIVVDLYGHMPDWDRITAVAERHGISVIEDAAEAVGSTYRGRSAGAFGRCAVFSFHGSKTLTTGEGGMIVCDDPVLYDRVETLRNHGQGDVTFFNEEIAFKYKMSSMQAALGLAQLERLDDLVSKKRQIFQWYRDRLGGSTGLTLNPDFGPVVNSYWMSTVLVDPAARISKEELIPAMTAFGVDTRPFFYPLSAIPAYRGTRQADLARARNTVAYALSRSGLNLPSALCLTENDADRVATTFIRVVQDLQMDRESLGCNDGSRWSTA